MDVSDFLSKDGVIACAKPTSKRQLLHMLAEKGAVLCGADEQDVFEILMAREHLGSTGLGNGIAIPHGKVKGLSGVVAVFAHLAAPVAFDAVDDAPVDLVFMLLAPEGAGADHLKALSRVARLMRTESTVQALRATKEPAEIYDILCVSEEGVAA